MGGRPDREGEGGRERERGEIDPMTPQKKEDIPPDDAVEPSRLSCPAEQSDTIPQAAALALAREEVAAGEALLVHGTDHAAYIMPERAPHVPQRHAVRGTACHRGHRGHGG